MKRALEECVAKCTRSKRPRLEPALVKDKKFEWIPATATRNYMMNDVIIDFLKLHYKNITQKHSTTFLQYIMQRGITFEKDLVAYINTNIIPCTYVSDKITNYSVNRTIELMSQGTPIIHSAPVRNTDDNTHGIIDLLVRSDYISRLVNYPPDVPTIDDGKYYYVVIDIKYSTLPLRADGTFILNDKKYRAYKSQLCIYNRAIGKIQGYTPQYSYILGRRYRYKSKNTTYSSTNSLDRLGVVDFHGIDQDFVEDTNKAIKWVKYVRKNHKRMRLNPPSHVDLYPNMSNMGTEWDEYKSRLAMNLGELTMLWYCGVKERKHAFKNGVKSWRDPKCCSRILGVNGTRAPVIDKIISINRDDIGLMLPEKINTNLYTWRNKSQPEVFVDFETIIDIGIDNKNTIPYQPKSDMIFMIGVAIKTDNKIEYKCFTAKSLDIASEKIIMEDFYNYMKSLNFPKMWYWCAENKFWSIAKQRHENKMSHMDYIDTKWCDLSMIFKTEPITIKGCFGYGLKSIAESMRNHGFITTKIESECNNGNMAMIQAVLAYSKSHDERDKILADIRKYNQYDCIVMQDILEYLRKSK